MSEKSPNMPINEPLASLAPIKVLRRGASQYIGGLLESLLSFMAYPARVGKAQRAHADSAAGDGANNLGTA
jgi:hypothetical protein